MHSLRAGLVLAPLLMTTLANGEEVHVANQKARAQLPPHMEMDCQQMTIVLPVAPAVAAQYLTPGRELALSEGAAQLFIPIKNCSEYSTTEESGEAKQYGPLSFFTVWLVVEGPLNPIDVPETLYSMPTYHVQSIGTFFESKAFWQDMKQIGADMKQPKEIALGAFGTPGYVFERGDEGFSWEEWLGSPVPSPLGLNIVDYRDSDAGPVVETIQCVMSNATSGSVKLAVNAESILSPFATGPELVLAGFTLDGEVHCTADFASQ